MIWVRKYYSLDLPPQEIGYRSWALWRWAQISPECIGYRDVEEVQWRVAT